MTEEIIARRERNAVMEVERQLLMEITGAGTNLYRNTGAREQLPIGSHPRVVHDNIDRTAIFVGVRRRVFIPSTAVI